MKTPYQDEVTYGTRTVSFRVVPTDRTTLGIRVHPDGKVEVRAPLEVDADEIRSTGDRMLLAVEVDLVHPCSCPQLGQLVGCRRTAARRKARPVVRQRPDRDVAGAVGFGAQLEAVLQTLEGIDADPNRFADCRVVDPRDVAVLNEPAQSLLEPVDLAECLVCALLAVHEVFMYDDDLEDRGHRPVGESAGIRGQGARLVLRPLSQRARPSAAFPLSSSRRCTYASQSSLRTYP